MKTLRVSIISLVAISCSQKPIDNAEITYEQISNRSDILFGEAEELFIEGKKIESAQKIFEGVEALKEELRSTPGLTEDRIDSIAFFLDELGQEMEDGTANVTEVQLVTALYRVQLMTAHDYLVFTARHLSNEELDSAQVSILHATSKMISGIDKSDGEPKTRLQVIHSETEALLNNLENRFQRDVTKIRHRLERLQRRLKELEDHILAE